jgi:hypothetical protein
MSKTKTLKEVLQSKNTGALNYVYNLGDDYLFIDSVKKNPAGENLIVHRHFDINRIPIQELTVDKFVNSFKDYSLNTHGLFGGKNLKKSRKHGFAKKRKTCKRCKTCKKRK